MELEQIVGDIAEGLVSIDSSGIAFNGFQAGVGPYGEPQLVRAIAEYMNGLSPYSRRAKTKRTPDLLIPGDWALEFKLARPFGDNGKIAENWSVNLLHPYPGNQSLIGDCLKLRRLGGPERKAVITVGYELTPPQISLVPLLRSFELVAQEVMKIHLAPRVEKLRSGLRHPVHQQVLIAGWEVLP
ncbi:MAG: hypothetical protein ACM3SW_10905 [Actinomycetota bacterium]